MKTRGFMSSCYLTKSVHLPRDEANDTKSTSCRNQEPHSCTPFAEMSNLLDVCEPVLPPGCAYELPLSFYFACVNVTQLHEFQNERVRVRGPKPDARDVGAHSRQPACGAVALWRQC